MITTKQMRILEHRAEKEGTPKLVLMERAGKGVADELSSRFPDKGTKVLFVCYHGNNGGDGLCAARHLRESGYPADVFFIGDRDKLTDEARTNYEMLMSIDPKIFVKGFDIHYYAVIVDCILGIGAVGPLRDNIANTVVAINSSPAFTVSVDVPTGINPDTGKKSEVSVDADLILTIHDLKPGLEGLRKKVKVIKIF